MAVAGVLLAGVCLAGETNAESAARAHRAESMDFSWNGPRLSPAWDMAWFLTVVAGTLAILLVYVHAIGARKQGRPSDRHSRIIVAVSALVLAVGFIQFLLNLVFIAWNRNTCAAGAAQDNFIAVIFSQGAYHLCISIALATLGFIVALFVPPTRNAPQKQ
jgi:ABC-type Fe3+ transport system permease subunit